MPPEAGTSFARKSRVASEFSAVSAAWRGHRDRFFMEHVSRHHKVMTLVGAAQVVASLSVMWAGGMAHWRCVAALCVFLGFSCLNKLVFRNLDTPIKLERKFTIIGSMSQITVITMVALTGGLHSPLTPSLIMSVIFALLFFGPHAVTARITMLLAVLCVVVAVLPLSVIGPGLPATPHAIAMLIGLAWLLFSLHFAVRQLSIASAAAAMAIEDLRESRVSDAQAQTRRLRSVGSKVAHELKNPLAAIKGLVQLVDRSPESERTHDRLAVVHSEIARMETILREYLSFARPLEDLKPEKIDVADVLNDIASVVAGRIDHGNLALTLDVSPTAIQADPRRLRDAMLNLVTNAIEATPAGGTIFVSTAPTADGAAIEVRDTGRGIADKHLSQLGTSFFTTRTDGTGLGVVLAQGVITQHGGTIKYESVLGAGTRVLVTLPTTPPSVAPLPWPEDASDFAPDECAAKLKSMLREAQLAEAQCNKSWFGDDRSEAGDNAQLPHAVVRPTP